MFTMFITQENTHIAEKNKLDILRVSKLFINKDMCIILINCNREEKFILSIDLSVFSAEIL